MDINDWLHFEKALEKRLGAVDERMRTMHETLNEIRTKVGVIAFCSVATVWLVAMAVWRLW